MLTRRRSVFYWISTIRINRFHLEKGASRSSGIRRVYSDGIHACYLNDWFIDDRNVIPISSATVFVRSFSRQYEWISNTRESRIYNSFIRFWFLLFRVMYILYDDAIKFISIHNNNDTIAKFRYIKLFLMKKINDNWLFVIRIIDGNRW